MKSKLTISIEKEILERAQTFSFKTEKSLSEMIEIYLDTLTKTDYHFELSSKLKSIDGAVQLPSDFEIRIGMQSLKKLRNG